jgi:hypothetical protein
MKNLFLFAVLCFLLFSCGGSSEVEIGNKTTLSVEPLYNAGKYIKGEVIKAKIKVRNTGSYPLVIADVTTSCSCTVPDKPKKPVQPGEEITIIARIDTKKTSGRLLNKSVNIVANTEPSVTTVVIKAEVEDK